MSHEFVDQIMEKNKAGELRSPVSETLEMQLVEFGRGEAVYEMEASEAWATPRGDPRRSRDGAGGRRDGGCDETVLNDEEIQKSAITTIDIFARFIRPVNAKKVERLRAEAKVVRAGGRLRVDRGRRARRRRGGRQVRLDRNSRRVRPAAYIAGRGGSNE